MRLRRRFLLPLQIAIGYGLSNLLLIPQHSYFGFHYR